ncbi:ABC transporter ATP-binding protein [Oculatella sp. FACHB-28]|uniref:heterocyst formation ABC transporter subunit HepA n=1 Tax=Cyanophyceae TaxID=3028117 RepID=UPI001686A209|nr:MULTISPECIES: heterocyst formation ABC transporter subunit HepA [Cyanophyceae]MBD2001466.1 ABC transporter ATP-binding protein [Leptolyngbya sp. FACHB-541]MBD2056616.1 ABC transporter ATP-binding protein [Oculatella sp. FACHB-28]MBD2070601.1 ABC transporter ATP-binding protein [Leptolyngbya sp. FACHB-671]
MKYQLPPTLRRIIKTTGFWKDNKLILREIKKFPHLIFLVLIFSLLTAVFEGFGISFLLTFLQNLVEPNSEPLQTGIQWIDVWILGVNASPLSRLYRISGLILLSTLFRVLFGYLSAIYGDFGRIKLINNLYKQVFEQLQAVSLRFYGQTKAGELLNTMTAEVSQLQEAVSTFTAIFVRSMVVVAYSILAVGISWELTVMAVLLFGLAAAGIASLNGWVRESSFPESRARGRLTSTAAEFINGIRTVHAFGTQEFERRRFYEASDNVAAAAKVATTRYAVVKPIAEAIASVVLIGILVLGISVFVNNGTLTVASLLTFIFIVIRAAPAIQEISGRFSAISRFQGPIQSIENLLSTENKPYLQAGHIQFRGLQQAIEFVGVDFGYDAESSVLKDITLTIPKGQTVALVGASGAGKSTLADLVIRFYDPTRGKILFDGIDLRELEINSVRHRMATVSQDTFIFNSTVHSNIAYGLDNISEAEVLEAARLANAVEFIQKMPEGLDTVLGDRGVRLSGGQRQRIAIARALLRNPEILILDEATSALDSVSERLIQKSLEELSVGRTVIAIAHRLSTIMRADQIIVLEQGRIVEQGTYQELLSLQGKLWKYHQMQHEAS